MLVIRDTSVVPNPDGWKYYIEETNFTVSTRNYTQLYPMIVRHCQSNGLAVPSEQQVIDQMCNKLYIPCYESESSSPLINKFFLGLPNPRPTGCCGR